jgi:hypothetical protein
MTDEQLGAVSEAVDLTAINAKQVAIVQDGSRAARSTGAVFIPFLDPATHAQTYVSSSQYGSLQVRGSCGVTFVSPHYAITASHCFANGNAYDPANQYFTTTQYDVSTSNLNDFYFDSTMSGSYPNYTPLFGHTMPQAEGYTSTSFGCKIASRCAFGDASNYNCDGISASDVTMLYCPGRAANAAWLPIANDSSTSGDVTMYWAHELFNTNNDPEKIAHYTNYSSSSISSNWHYLAAPTNAYLPFKSVPWSTGARKRIGAGGSTDVMTDLWGCHGTSGSGVLNGTATELLGPVHVAGSAWGFGRLCDDPTALTPGAPGGHGLSYSSNVSVNNLVNAKYLSTLQSDRNPPPPPAYCGDGMCNGTESHASCPGDCDVGDCTGGKIDCCGDGVCRTAIMCRKAGCL